MIELKVQGMSCQNCVRHVREAILAGDATAKVEVQLKEGLVKVETILAREEVTRLITEEGYQVS